MKGSVEFCRSFCVAFTYKIFVLAGTATLIFLACF